MILSSAQIPDQQLILLTMTLVNNMGISDMRHIVYSMMAVVALCLSTGCHREQDVDIPKEEGSRMITVHASQAAETRTTIVYQGQDGNDNPVYKSIWQAGDQIQLFQVCSHTWESDSSSPLGEDVDAITDFQVPAFIYYHQPTEDEQVHYVGASSGYYGVSFLDYDDLVSIDAWGDSQSASSWGIRGYIPDEQNPSKDSFDRNADLLLSKMVTSTGRSYEMDLYFARIGSIARITLKGLPEGDRVMRGRLSVGESWLASGEVIYDPTHQKVAYLPIRPIKTKSSESFTSSIYFLPEDVYVDENGEAVIWLRTMAGTLSDHFAISVETWNPDTDRRTSYQKVVDLESLNVEIPFNEGEITAFNVRMEKAPSLKFSWETLNKFPELDNDNPVLRLPRDYDFYDVFSIYIDTEEYEWDVTLEGAEGFLNIDCRYNWIYLDVVGEPHYLRSAKMILSCDELGESYEIPVEEYLIMTIKKDDEIIWDDEGIILSVGEEATLTAELQIPNWIDKDNWISWRTSDGYGFIDVGYDSNVSVGEGQVQGISVTNDDVHVLCDWSIFDRSLDETKHMIKRIPVTVVPFLIAMNYEGKDMSGKIITMAANETISLEAGLKGITEDDIQSVTWSVIDVDGEDVLSVSGSTNLTASISSNGRGIAVINLHVVLNSGEESDFYCGIIVTSPGGPVLSDFIKFDKETLAYFPELASDENPMIRIPLFSSINKIPLFFESKLPGFFFECYLEGRFLDVYDDPWLECYYDPYFDEEGNSAYVIYYDSYWRNLDGPLSTSMVFECKELGVNFRVPVVDYDFFEDCTFLFCNAETGEEYDEDSEVTIPVGGTITLKASFAGLPHHGYWITDSEYFDHKPSSVVSIGTPSADNEVVVTGIGAGGEGVNYLVVFDESLIESNPWLPDVYFLWCDITVTDEVSPSQKIAMPKSSLSRPRFSRQKGRIANLRSR